MQSSPITQTFSNGEHTDAYLHIGVPRFGSPQEIIRFMDACGISRAVTVLGPLVPDLESVLNMMAAYPQRIRGVGLPFGAEARQRTEFVRIQLDAGLIGIRMGENETLENPDILSLIGERERAIYALNPIGNPGLAETYLNWLERYPGSFIAAPHFLRPNFSLQDERRHASGEELLRHPRFYAIFSRQGGNGSTQSYPHPDFVPWLIYVLEHCGWERILWGSEFPVFLWRNETFAQCSSWLAQIWPETDERQLASFRNGNAQKLFFTDAEPGGKPEIVPKWLKEQFAAVRNRDVPLFPSNTLDLPGELYFEILREYIHSHDFSAIGPNLSQFIIGKLRGDHHVTKEMV